MADSATLINVVRRKMLDWFNGVALDQVYSDDYYQDAIDLATGRFNADTGFSYSIATLPAKYDWVLTLLATIEMCEVRIMEQGGTTGTGPVKRVGVPGAEVEHYEGSTAKDWVKFGKQLEDRYQAWLESEDFNAPPVTNTPYVVMATTTRTSLRRNRGIRDPRLDRGIDAVDLVATVEVDGTVLLTWESVYDSQFYYMILQRMPNGSDWDEDATDVFVTYDNHVDEYEDTDAADLSAGIYLYRPKMVNRGGIITYGTVISVTLS